MSQPHSTTIQPNQTVLDYKLQERIGAGGYGEVWSVEAPGGLFKAIKFVFGYHDDNRAQRELKALDRVKQARHPFLLSLERIDVVDGRLIVVTELADMSIKDRFNQCRAEGLEGIAREELLAYVRESADALDYLADTYSLAHLDIKPENLLIVGGHVKVADFGLVKDFNQTNQSLMDGLTPAYASPELFDGRPGRASDQYSLAIVYQEMLTGTRPFSGTTTAQLASQHLHSRPNLNPLPRADQAVVARALAKRSEDRYPDCRSMAEELFRRRTRIKAPGVSGRSKPGLGPINTSGQTNAEVDLQAVSDIEAKQADATLLVSGSFVPAMKFDSELEKLKPFDLSKAVAQVRPTLFIGVGQTATRALRKLRGKLSRRFGSADAIPAFRLLCLDTDRRALFDATLGEEEDSLQNHEILNIPLRKSEEYRNDGNMDLSWLGRRWIYNVPKSQQTEGLRPLGRLAFVDHHETVFQKLNDEIGKLATAEALATTAETCGLSPADVEPQVVIVSSISGGLGSGMVLDLAYATRVVLAEKGLPDQRVFGLLTHATFQSLRDNRVAIANTYSFLNEYYHYCLHGFPACDYCQLPSFDEQNPAFDATYLVHLGDDLSESDFDLATDSLAEYLYLNSATTCASFFDKCRDADEIDPSLLRSVGINFLRRGKDSLCELPARALAERLLQSWMSNPRTSSKADAHNDSAEVAVSALAQAKMSGQDLDDQFQGFLIQHIGDDPLRELSEEINKELKAADASQLISIANHVLGRRLGNPDTSDTHELTLCTILEQAAQAWGKKYCAPLEQACFAVTDDPARRFAGAQAVADAISELLQLRSVEMEKRSQLAEEVMAKAQSEYERMLGGKEPPSVAEDWNPVLFRYVQARVESITARYQRKLLWVVGRSFAHAKEQLAVFRQQLDMVKQQLALQPGQGVPESSLGSESRDLGNVIVEQQLDQLDSYVPQLDERVEQEFLAQQGGLLSVLKSGGHPLRQLRQALRRESQIILSTALQNLRIDTLLRDYNFSPEEIADWLNELVSGAQPKLLECGGTTRLLVGVPQQAPVTSIANFIENQYDHEANVIRSTCGDVVVCFEMGDIPMENVAMMLLQIRSDCVDLVKRLHVRNDLEWTSLTPLC